MTSRHARILAIDDTPANLMTLGAVLEGEFELQIATSGPAGIELALKRPPDLILLDVMMPEVDGFETFRRLVAQPTLANIPVVFVTALNDANSEAAGLSLGAADYITKPINVTIARHRIRNLVERAQLRNELGLQRDRLQEEVARRVKSEELVRQLAFHDALTGLPNRLMLNDRLGQVMAACKRNGQYGALMFLDLDNFKPINDAHGHELGDFLLMEVAGRLTDCVREVDTVVRLGGDEFVVMLGELDADKAASTEHAMLVAEKIRVSLAQPYILALSLPAQKNGAKELRCEVSASIGLAVFSGHEACQADILKWADAAMYRVKETGRNAVAIFD
jgi:diguanylate cyclase (GGDEF)-like protein